MHRTGKLYLLTFFAIIFLSAGKSSAQENIDNNDIKNNKLYDRSLILSIDYSSDKVFYGRKSNQRIVYFSPSLLYEARSGFYTGFTSYRLVKPENRWDEAQLIAGWDFTLLKKIKTSASYSRFAYSDSSVQIQSSLKNNLELSLNYDSKIIQPKLTGSLYFGSASPDYLFTFELYHEFEFDYLLGNNDDLYIRPTAMLNAGTLHFYRLLPRDSLKRSLATKEVTKFNLSGIDFSLPIEYDIGKFIIEFSANYNIPLNQPKYLKAEPGFYYTAGIGFRII